MAEKKCPAVGDEAGQPRLEGWDNVAAHYDLARVHQDQVQVKVRIN
jgi:hypothetical protein